jgi:hypothetical protein
MAEDLTAELRLLEAAVKDRDAEVLAGWVIGYKAWVNGDRSGPCPFETEDALKRTHSLKLNWLILTQYTYTSYF